MLCFHMEQSPTQMQEKSNSFHFLYELTDSK